MYIFGLFFRFSILRPILPKFHNVDEIIILKGIFLPSGRKAQTSRPLGETKLPLSGAVEQKNGINTLASKKEPLVYLYTQNILS